VEASSDEQSGGLLPKSRTEWQERVQRTISELRRTDLSPCVMECYWRSPAGHLSASIDGVLNEVAIRGGISAQWVEQPHWEPDEDDPDGWQDGTRYRAATGEETSPANSALREALVWHGMRVDENGEHLTDVRTVAVPIRDYTRTVVGSLAVSGPAYRIGLERLEQELVPLTIQAGKELSNRLGHPLS